MGQFLEWVTRLNYDQYRFADADSRRIRNHELIGFLVGLGISPVRKNAVGFSFEGRKIEHLSWGRGPVSILLWSQMHGNEPTATLALLDLLSFLHQEKDSPFCQWLSGKVTLHLVPMLNPDGAERFTRRNALGIDLNRDALDLVSPESRFLKAVKDQVNPVWGFNLHDQNPRYSVGSSGKPAMLSLLAPAFDRERRDNENRLRAKKLTGFLRQQAELRIGPHVGKYDDAFGARCFGDNMQKWGVSTILIESGGWYQSPEKAKIRELNFRLFLAAFEAIASGEVDQFPVEWYETIPFNGPLLPELKLERTFLADRRVAEPVLTDLAINYPPMNDLVTGKEQMVGVIADVGDLHTVPSMATLDFSSWILEPMRANFMPMPVTTDVVKRSVMEGIDTFFYPAATDPKRLKSQIALSVNLHREDFHFDHNTTSLLPGERASFRILDKATGEVAAIWINGFEVYSRERGWQQGVPWVMPNHVRALEVEL
ncbi:MAG: peptidase M14 [Bacteroidetes bacterium]|nr:peptidase M14 [Bacteroidota bacterium]